MSDRINSIHNPRIRQAARLRHRAEREQQQRCLIDGAREISRAIEANVPIVELFVCEASLRPESRQLVERAVERGVRPCWVPAAVLGKLAFGDRNEGLVAIARPPQASFTALRLPAEPLIVVLAGIEKPGNIGAVARSADAGRVSALIVADGGTDLFNPNVIRASLGTIFTLPVLAASSEQARQWLTENQIQVFATRVGSALCYTGAALTGRTALVLGNEAEGLRQFWTGDDVTPISLPMLGVADSLNVSVTAGILIYEALRQRRAAAAS